MNPELGRDKLPFKILEFVNRKQPITLEFLWVKIFIYEK